MPLGVTITVAVASPIKKGAEIFSFYSLRYRGEVIAVYITLEQLVLLASFIVALLALVQNHNNNKKR